MCSCNLLLCDLNMDLRAEDEACIIHKPHGFELVRNFYRGGNLCIRGYFAIFF